MNRDIDDDSDFPQRPLKGPPWEPPRPPKFARELHAVDETNLTREHRLAMAAERRRLTVIVVALVALGVVIVGWLTQ